MSIYKKHIFVCENQRSPDDPYGCCASKGARELTAELKKYCNEAGLKGIVRINKAGCLGQCSQGPVLVIYPDGIWFNKVTKNRIESIFKEHILKVNAPSTRESD